MAVSYMLQFLDKISITQSAIMGIRPELVCTSLFFFFFSRIRHLRPRNNNRLSTYLTTNVIIVMTEINRYRILLGRINLLLRLSSILLSPLHAHDPFSNRKIH